ncbi:MAG: pseudouridine synthase [Candidatus Saccharicenans sp.]|nr:pseudouridine synthase [Candidatus Saccharicenans sp.]
MLRLNKFLAQAGVASRREADRLIQDGRVKINGRVVTELGVKIDEFRDRIEVDHHPVKLPSEQIYLLLNKPAGYIVTLDDPQGRKTVMDLLPRLPVRVFPVGRLDAETEGLLLFTNDGELAHRLIHPRYEIKKLYEVRVKGFVEDKDLDRLQKGVFIDGRKSAPARARIIYRNREKSLISLEIHEGRKHEVRKMLSALGFEVKKLRRVSFAGITVKGLRRGFWRRLKPEEVARLRKMTGLAD